MNKVTAYAKNLGMKHNVSLRVIDVDTHKIVSEHIGHNAATNGLVTGIGHYLAGDGILNQGWHLLSSYVPKYISLGTMGLVNQDSDEFGLPAGIGIVDGEESKRFQDYMLQCPGYGADGYDPNLNNNRKWFGLGPMFKDRDAEAVINCELISDTFPRAAISFRDVVPETESEFPQTVDVVFSAMVSTGALAQFREPGKDYVYITEAGLWSRSDWVDGGDNGLLAGYRIAPPNQSNWGMTPESITDEVAVSYLERHCVYDPSESQIENVKPEVAANNREVLKRQILRVNKNQVVQVIWKIQIGGLEQLTNINYIYPDEGRNSLKWIFW